MDKTKNDRLTEKRNNAEAVFREYSSMMFNVANSILHNDADAEDAVSESLRILWEKDKFPDAKSITAKAYLIIVVKNTALNMLKKDRQLLEDDFDEFVQNIPAIQEDDGIISSIARLPDDLRELIILRYYVGYSAKEIAELKGEKENTVFVKIARAKKALKQIIEEES